MQCNKLSVSGDTSSIWILRCCFCAVFFFKEETKGIITKMRQFIMKRKWRWIVVKSNRNSNHIAPLTLKKMGLNGQDFGQNKSIDLKIRIQLILKTRLAFNSPKFFVFYGPNTSQHLFGVDDCGVKKLVQLYSVRVSVCACIKSIVMLVIVVLNTYLFHTFFFQKA